MVRRRHIFHIAGYDAIRPLQQHRRFIRELGIFRETWDVQSAATDCNENSGYPMWFVRTQGPGWTTDAHYELFAWDDIVAKDTRGADISRLFHAAVTYLDLALTGTLFRYALANTRYFAFTLFPLAQLALLGCVSWGAATLVAAGIGLSDISRLAFVALAGLAGFFVLLRWPGRRWKLQHALDDWNFARAYVYKRHPEFEARLQTFAEHLVRRIREGGADEAIIVGHSLGAPFAIEIVARALDADADLGRRGVDLSVLTIGATIPKCALHPAAGHLRKRIVQVANERSVYWAEYQARADAISFYRFDPVQLRRTGKGDQLDHVPVIRRVQIHDMLRKETFAKYRLRVLRLHYQFVMANDVRSTYDYFMMVCGPVAFRRWTASPRGFLDFVSIIEGSEERKVSTSG